VLLLGKTAAPKVPQTRTRALRVATAWLKKERSWHLHGVAQAPMHPHTHTPTHTDVRRRQKCVRTFKFSQRLSRHPTTHTHL
jgi:hypothetical protein